MPRPSKLSAAPLAQVRRYFGLDQPTLAAYLGVGAGMVGHVEAGRRPSGPKVTQRLLPLLQAAFAAPDAPSAAPAAHLAAPEADPLQARLAWCRHHAGKLRRELDGLTNRMEVARRWQAALPELLAQAADERARAWLVRRQEAAAADLDADTSARYHLLRLRLAALAGEATELEKLIPPETAATHGKKTG